MTKETMLKTNPTVDIEVVLRMNDYITCTNFDITKGRSCGALTTLPEDGMPPSRCRLCGRPI